MDYKLAKELKEGGYPQTWTLHNTYYEKIKLNNKYEICERRINTEDTYRNDRVYIPNLEELIQVIGNKLEAITHEQSQSGNEWVASSFEAMGGVKTKHARGETATTAVAKLWILLNK